ncbi:MAG TPA: GNAT family N-acetyltransferase [Flexivirga sp.]|uniref:NUDIX hydrolase n=1 Tax=Flexivirga sp. TaxID=1962927 RepID=UPI002D0D3647|nr:GNAT family N-acetyltransferase [Flexivirga sp.]HWC23168.1 GNAT family N-acetyltransferase [Flexivirga sp.]
MTQAPHHAPVLGDGRELRRLVSGTVPRLEHDVPGWVRDDGVHLFAIDDGDERAGLVALRLPEHRDGAGQLAWQLRPESRGRGLAAAALRAVVEHGFTDLGLHRVEAYVARTNRPALRSAALAGLRSEGVLREFRPGVDALVLGRLVDDPAPGSRDAFTAWLNSALPTKRAIAQALIRDESGRLLVCELVYKKPWDLPGGVVDPLESPAAAVVRELREELGVTARVRSLAAVSWLPAWRGWDDATLFIFDVSVPAQELGAIQLEAREIRAVHWCEDAEFAQHAADYTVRVARQAVAALDAGSGTVYLEDGHPPVW